MYKTTNINDLEMIYSLLREQHPTKQIEIEYNDNDHEYTLNVTNKKYIEDPNVPVDINVKIIYGDSITGDTPLLLRDPYTNLVHIETIENIFDENKKVEYPGFKIFDKTIRLEKEYSLTDFEVWTDQGWKNIRKVIRHKCNKKIYRVLTHTGCVDVSEDHSLIKENGERIKPCELQLDDCLLHSFPDIFVENKTTIVKMKKKINETKVCYSYTCKIEKDINEFYKRKDKRINKCRDCEYYKYYKNKLNSHLLRNIMKDFKFENYQLTEKEAEVWGMFMADGSCGSYSYSYNCKSGIKNSWALNNQDLKRLNYFKDILESIEPIKFEILDTLESSGVYKLVPKGSIKYMVDKYRPLFYYQFDCNADGDKYKIVPNCILNASRDIKLAYWKGYYEGDGSKTGYNHNHIEQPGFAIKGKIGAQCMYYLMRSIGFNMGINITSHVKKQEMYFLNYTTFKFKKEINIKKIIEKEITRKYIYDIETDIGKFGCGIGQLQAANTDSVFLRMQFNRDNFEKNREDTFRLATICGDNITEMFGRSPVELEFEKVFQPFILLTKKRYIGKKYEDTKDPFKLKEITTAGIALTRRDYCKMVKKCYKEVIDKILDGKDTESAINESIEIFKKYIDRIENYQIETDDLQVSAMLAKHYACGNCKERVEWYTSLNCNNKVGNKICNEPNLERKETCKKCKQKIKCLHTFSLGHINLAQKMLQRHEDIQVNDRIQFILVESENANATKKDFTEEIKYAKEHNLKYNRSSYLEQLAKPMLSFYRVVLSEHEDIINELVEYTNDKILELGGKKLKMSDFKIIEEN
jgi:hypothetical protein